MSQLRASSLVTSRILKGLTFGYTQGASANGFYQIPVIASDPQNDDFALDKGSLKEAAKNVLAKLQNPKESNFELEPDCYCFV